MRKGKRKKTGNVERRARRAQEQSEVILLHKYSEDRRQSLSSKIINICTEKAQSENMKWNWQIKEKKCPQYSADEFQME